MDLAHGTSYPGAILKDVVKVSPLLLSLARKCLWNYRADVLVEKNLITSCRLLALQVLLTSCRLFWPLSLVLIASGSCGTSSLVVAGIDFNFDRVIKILSNPLPGPQGVVGSTFLCHEGRMDGMCPGPPPLVVK